MSEYDSILKEKKKKTPAIQPEPPEEKHFPYVIVSIIAIILLLLISYIVYYNTILAKDIVILNNLNILKEEYESIFDHLYLENFQNDNIEGTITINQTNNYSFIKEQNNYYLKTPTLNKYINNLYNNSININTENIKKYISEDKYIKTFYLEQKTPIVEINLVLNRTELEQITNYSFLNDYEVRITSQNNALTNEIISMKIVINDLITSARKVITIENNTIYYKDDDHDLKFDVNITNNDFKVKTYKNDTLYSVLTGTEKTNLYSYTYQIIDELYTLNLDTRIEDDKYIYEFNSSIENVKEEGILTITNISNDLTELVNYSDLSDIDKKSYDEEKNFLLKFINKYKNNI